jgi:RIO-like serine/threonine protein kinase
MIGGYTSVMRSNNTSIIYYLDASLQVTSQVKAVFVKKVIHDKYSHYDFVNKEVFWLNKMKDFDRVPKVISFNTNSIVMDYMGMEINKHSRPIDWQDQVEYILDALNRIEVSHNDIKIEEILVGNGKINIIDFQHTTSSREEFRELRSQGKVTVEPYVKDDRTSLYTIIGEL